MWEFEEVDGDLGDVLLKKFTNCFRSGYIKSRGYILPESYKKCGQRVEELEVRDDDLWVVSFPKTGKFSPSNVHSVETCLQRNIAHILYSGVFVFKTGIQLLNCLKIVKLQLGISLFLGFVYCLEFYNETSVL
jgi:hypothetical protein